MPEQIRPESPPDIDAIEALTLTAFANAAHTSHTEQFIVAGLRRAGCLSVSLVAEMHGVLIGHVAASPVTITDGSGDWFGLGPLSVLPAYQRRGVGSRLMHEALRRLRDLGAGGCVVLGDPHYYGRFGFKADSGLVLPGVPAEYFQVLVLAASPARGTVSYHAAFEARD